jgi:cystathionine gamma-synthase
MATDSPALAPDTLVVAAGRPERAHDSPVNPSIELSTTFHETRAPQPGDRVYGRMSNPTWDPFEEALGRLEGAALPALVFSSGLGAAAAALALVPDGMAWCSCPGTLTPDRSALPQRRQPWAGSPWYRSTSPTRKRCWRNWRDWDRACSRGR